ncbi:MAG: AAA family ATPase [Mycobacterium sp.]
MTATSSLAGRHVELDLITGVLNGTAPEPVVFVGDSGVGKTALLEAARQTAEVLGFTVLRAAGLEFDANVIFSGLNEVFLTTTQIFGELRGAHRDAMRVALGLGHGPPPSPLMICNATLSALERLACQHPIALIVDDLQWLDHASASALAFSIRRSSPRIRFIGATAPGSPFIENSGIAEHNLTPLTGQAAGELLGTQFPLLTGRIRHRLLADARGNPLALIELAVAATNEVQGTAPVPPTAQSLNPRLKALYAARVQALPAPTRELLLLAALNSADELPVLTPALKDDTLAVLGPAERDHLISLHESGRIVVFRHPLVRSTVLELAHDLERRKAQHALASAWVEQPDRHAWHLAEAIGVPDEHVASLLETAARSSLHRGDAVRAAELLVRSSEASPVSADRCRRVIEAAALRAEVTGGLGAASAMLKAALRDEPTLTNSLVATVTAAQILINADCKVDTAHRLLVTAIDKHPLRHDPDDRVLLDALHTLLLVCWMTGRAESWAPLDAVIASLASPAPASLLLCRAMFGDPARCDPAMLADLLEPALSGLRYESNPVAIIRAHFACVYVDRLGDCREALRRVIRDGREHGAVALAINALIGSAVDDWRMGRWTEAERLVSEGYALSTAAGYRRYSFVLGDYIGSLISTARGDQPIGLEAADTLNDMASTTGCGLAADFALHLRVLSATAAGDFENAYQYAAAISSPGTLAPFKPHALWVLFDLVEAAIKTDRREEARAHTEAMRHAGLAELSSRLALVYTACSAMTGPANVASMRFMEALATPGAVRWQFDYGRVQLAYGEHLVGEQRNTDARTHLDGALHVFEILGARPWAARARQALRAIGLSPSVPAELDLSALSARDWQVARLAASGLTNKQIGERLHMSHRSVGGHLYRIFPLLGISTRAALHDVVQSHGPRPDNLTTAAPPS